MTRRGMTLVEMLVAMTATLLLMAAVAQAFAVFGSAITGSRGVLDLDARMRSVAWRLRSDLAGITVRPLPPITPESAQGYLEIIEGPLSDYEDASNGGAALVSGTAVGPTDVDDVLLFTTQSLSPPFVGRAPGSGQTFESTVAEVAWFARRTPTPNPSADSPPTYTLYRRQLLVMGYVGVTPFVPDSALANNNAANFINLPLQTVSGSTVISSGTTALAEFYNYPCDVSVRREGNTLVPNTLADLSRREARFLHNMSGTAAFPYLFLGGSSHQDVVAGNSTQLPAALAGLTFDPVTPATTAPRQGEDVVLTDVIAFDVRVFDPAAAVRLAAGSTPLVPGDPDFSSSGADRGTGAYVDLDHGGINNSLVPATVTPNFKSPGQAVGSSTATLPRTYDTWSLAYEANGRDDDQDGVIDQALDGQDSPVGGVTNNVIDDPAEFETRPPYPYPLRGIEVRLRCYEPESRQVRQVTIRHTFVPH